MDNIIDVMQGFRKHLNAISWLALISFCGQISVSFAGIVVDSSAPTGQQPVVSKAANGVTTINIQTPSQAGVSRNTYSKFDVSKQGVILNNAKNNAQTQLGGWIQGNPFLADGGARVILNEVNSNNPSLLQGYIEVAGSRAQVVLANPIGVTCDGCGFINANRATLTTGLPILNNGHLDGYRVEGGTITISGAGLNGSQTDYTDVISRSIQINAGIWANVLNSTVGSNIVSADAQQVQPLNGSGTTPALAIDVSELGGMYAGKIHLIGTENGVGVSNSGYIGSSVGELVISIDGHLENTGAINSLKDMQLGVTGDIVNKGDINSRENIRVNSAGKITNLGNIAANENALIQADGSIINNATLSVSGQLELTTSTLDNQSNGEIVASHLFLTASDSNTLFNRGLIDGIDTIIDTITLENIGSGRIYGDHVAIMAETVINTAEIENGVSTSAVIAARNRLDIGSQTLDNSLESILFSAGDIFLGGSLNDGFEAIGEADSIINNSATIEALGNININAKSLINKKSVFSTERILSTDLPSDLELLNYDPALKFQWYIVESSPSYWRNTVRDKYINHIDTFPGITISSAYRSQLNSLINALPLSVYQDSINIWKRLVKKINNDHPEWITIMADTLSAQNFPLKSYDQWCRDTECDYISYVTRKRTDYKDILISDSLSSTILAGGSGTLNIGDITNLYSSIEVGGDLFLTGNTLTNQGAELYLQSDIITSGATSHWLRGLKYPFSYASSKSSLLKTVPAIISAGGSLTGTFLERIDNKTIRQNSAPATSTSGTILAESSGGITLPVSSLFTTTPEPSSHYLIETDPQFASYRNWLSSDYLLDQIQLDPTTTQKRLGDGFYEQRLIREQIAQLTGRRFLSGYADDESQYQALMNAGITFANEHQLIPGIALTETQIAQLTSDIVWLVEQQVILADGSSIKVLVPQVYVKLQEGDLKQDGSLLLAENIELNSAGDINNSGTIAGRNIVRLTADNVQNIGGQIHAGNKLNITTYGDLNVISSTRQIDVTQKAGATVPEASVKLNQINRVAGLYVTNPDGVLIANAGKNLNIEAGEIINRGTNGQTFLAAGDNLNITTVEQSSDSYAKVGRNWTRENRSKEIGSRLETNGDITLVSGNDLNIRASKVTSEEGSIKAIAMNDFNIESGKVEHHRQQYNKSSKKGFLSSKKTVRFDTLDKTTAIATTLSGNSVDIQAGKDLTVSGSNVVATDALLLSAANDVIIKSATQTHEETHYKKTKKSGFLSGGGFGFTIGSQKIKTTNDHQQVINLASTVGSLEGDVTIQAGNNYRQTGSDVIAIQGDIDINAKKVDIEAAYDRYAMKQTTEFSQKGIGISITNPVISTVQTGINMKKAADATSDTRMKLLAVGATALAGKNAYDAVKMGQGTTTDGKPNQIPTIDDEGNPTSRDANAADKVGGINLSVSMGSSKSSSKRSQIQTTTQSSKVAAGGDITINAIGAGKNSDLTVIGSQIIAGNNLELKAQDQVNLLAAANTDIVHSKNKSSSASAGMSFGTDGLLLNVGSAKGKGKENGQSVIWTETNVQGGQIVTLESGTDTNIKGTIVSGNQVVADIGSNFNIESLQDTTNYKAKQRNIGGSLSIGYGNVGGSFSVSKSDIDANYASVTEQSGIKAGEGGFQINVGGNTDLKGAVIASKQSAIGEGLNSLITQTITSSDIQNKAEYEADAVSATFGVGVQGGEPQLTGGGIGTETGHNDSLSISAISEGELKITNNTAQVATTIAKLNRDVYVDENGNFVNSRGSSTANTISPIFDAEKVLNEINAQVQITQAFGQQASKVVSDYVQSRRAALQDRLDNADSKSEKAIVNKELDDLLIEERVMNVLIGAVTGMGESALTKESLSIAAAEMREIMIADSMKFAGVTDGETVLTNQSGQSEGVRGDGFKLGGTRIGLDKLCGAGNQRCLTDENGDLTLNEKKQIIWDLKDDKGKVIPLETFLKSEEGMELAGTTGGIQGWAGTLFGIPYPPGSLPDKVIEAFSGTHDYVGGELSGLYDGQGNATRGRSDLEAKAQDTWSATGAILVSTPFAAAELLPAEVWNAISILLSNIK